MFGVIVTGAVVVYVFIYMEKLRDETDPISRFLHWTEAKYFKLKLKLYGKKIR